MIDPHLTEEALQLYALDPGSAGPEVRGHLAACADCRGTAEAYRLLLDALKEQPMPVFPFDLGAVVADGLEVLLQTGAPASGAGKPGRISRSSAVVIALLIAIPAWFFRKTAWFAFSAASAGLAGIILGAAGIAVLFTLYKYYRRYQQVLHLINN
ncbi:MAG TPA: hypothetical protein VN616_05290 [Puia sp.]|nr:hypothetical protein [Puia sp.]